MSILITGGAGFIGSHLIERLLAATDEPLVALDNFNDYYAPELKRASIAPFANEPRVTLVEGDFRDPALVSRTFEQYGVRKVVHLGASPGVPFSIRHPLVTSDNNVQGTLVLLEAARLQKVERFLFASSSTVYGRGAAIPFVEDAPLGAPQSVYGATKRMGELLGLTYLGLYGLPFVSLRLFNVYGARLRPELALAVFTRSVLEGQPIPLYGDGTVERDFTHVSDICSGIITALSADGIIGEAINLGNHNPIAMRDLIRLIEQAAGKPAQIDYRPARPEDLPRTCADLTKARRLLGYEPTVRIDQGVVEYVEWMRAQLSGG